MMKDYRQLNKLMTDIASEFSTSVSYAVDDYCMYNDQLYRFITAHPAGSWNSDHVTAVSKITSEITRKLSDAPSDNKEYARKNGEWSEVTGGGGGGGTWGSITGTLSDQTDLQTALNTKASKVIIASEFRDSVVYSVGDYCIYQGYLYRFKSDHTAGAWNYSQVVQVAVMTEIQALKSLIESRMDFKITGTVSASNYTLTDYRINDNHWEVESIYFATPSNVTSQIHWTTDITNHQVSLSATYAGSTNVVVKMHWVQ